MTMIVSSRSISMALERSADLIREAERERRIVAAERRDAPRLRFARSWFVPRLQSAAAQQASASAIACSGGSARPDAIAAATAVSPKAALAQI
jgi:hypothetical protein